MPTRALIVDDNAALASNLAEILAMEGFEPVVVTNPRDALVRAQVPDLHFVLLDVRMPGISGVELHLTLRSLHPGAFFMLMTAFADPDELEPSLSAGAMLVEKPFPIEVLLRSIAKGQLGAA